LGNRSAGKRPGSEDGHELRQTKDVDITAPTPTSTSPLREGAGLKCQEDAAAQERRAAREGAGYADTTPWTSLRKKQRKVGTPWTPTQRRRLHQPGVDYTATLREHTAAPWPLFSLPELCTFAPPYEFVSSSPFCEPGFDPCLVQEPKPPFFSFLQTLSACVGQPLSRACA
jgi:hypothetical protein